jgi:hypothetical protein
LRREMMAIWIDPNIILDDLRVDERYLIELIAQEYSPEYVFSGREHELHEWARDHGYVKEEDIEEGSDVTQK